MPGLYEVLGEGRQAGFTLLVILTPFAPAPALILMTAISLLRYAPTLNSGWKCTD